MEKADFEAFGFESSKGDTNPLIWFFNGGDKDYPLRLMYDTRDNNLRLTTSREAGFYGQIIAGITAYNKEELTWVFDRIRLVRLLPHSQRQGKMIVKNPVR